MVLIPIWLNKENVISNFDEAFNSAADSFLLEFKHKINCSRFSIPVKKITYCKSTVKFFFDLDDSIQAGEYCVIIRNSTADEDYVELKIKIY